MTFRTHRVTSEVNGAKLENDTQFHHTVFTLGLDTSTRNWYGRCLNEPSRTLRQVRIPDVDTINHALYLKSKTTLNKYLITMGLRFDQTRIEANKNSLDDSSRHMIPMIQTQLNTAVSTYYSGKDSNDYNNVSGNIYAKYNYTDATNIALGLGRSIRVPDAQELYFISIMGTNWSRQGNPDLKETINDEIDLSFETVFGNTALKTTVFYSKLTDYIYAYKQGMKLTFTNIDATMMGGDIKAESYLTDTITAQASLAYQRGKKDDAITGQTDTDLAEVPPLKIRLAMAYDDMTNAGLVELINSANQTIDSDNGEEKMDGYTVANLKASRKMTPNWTINAGIDNILDETYAVNNSYVGRGLISSNGTDPLVLNEPGRYVYAGMTYTF
jgi:iron complex outermembrane receptor protein